MFRKLRKTLCCTLLCSSLFIDASSVVAGSVAHKMKSDEGLRRGSPAARHIELPPPPEPEAIAHLPGVVAAVASSEASSAAPRVFGIRRALDRLRDVRPSGESAENFWNTEFSDTQRRAVDRFWLFSGENAAEERAALRREVFQIAQDATYSEHLTAIHVVWYAPMNLQDNETVTC